MDIRVKNPYAFDLDIDLFNDSGRYLESKLWTETQLDDFFGICTPLIRSASIVTIAMSFGYSGTNEDTIWLAQYAVSKILEINHPAASGRGINSITSHREGRCPRTNHWIPACAGMTAFAASCGESNPQRLKG